MTFHQLELRHSARSRPRQQIPPSRPSTSTASVPLGIDYTIVDVFKKAGHNTVPPIVGADNNGFIGQLLNAGTAGRRR